MNKQIIMVGSDHYYREKVGDTWKIISTKIYILDVTTKKYYFKNGVPEIIIFSHPDENNAGWSKWCLLWHDKAGMVVKSYKGVKSAKFAARRLLRGHLNGFEVKNARFENWFQTSQKEEGPRADSLIELARKKIKGEKMTLLDNTNGRIATAVQILDAAKEFGNISAFSWQEDGDRIVMCRNNGQFHRGDMDDFPGYATFVGNVLKAYIEENYELYLRVHEAQELGLIR